MTRSTAQSSQRYPLTQVLGTEANVRLLRALSLHGGQLSAPSLVLHTGLAKGSVRTGLRVLAGFGVVTVAGSRQAQLYSMRLDHPLTAPLQTLFEAEQARFGAIQDAIRQAATKCDPAPVATYLYGSVARGQDRLGSDLDILVVAEHDQDASKVAVALRDALREPGERIGFVPSVVGLSLQDLKRCMGDTHSAWRESLQEVVVLSGRGPPSLVRARRGAAE